MQRRTDEEVAQELERISLMSLHANKAKAFARLMWQERDLSPRLRRFFIPVVREKVDRAFLLLSKEDYDRRQRWWREKNLPVELKKRGKGFIPTLARLFQEMELHRAIAEIGVQG